MNATSIRAEVFCSDGSVISVDKISAVIDKKNVYIDRLKSYRDVVTIDQDVFKMGLAGDVLEKVRDAFVYKNITKIEIFVSQENLDTNEIEEKKVQCFESAYIVADIYHAITFEESMVNNIIRYIFAA